MLWLLLDRDDLVKVCMPRVLLLLRVTVFSPSFFYSSQPLGFWLLGALGLRCEIRDLRPLSEALLSILEVVLAPPRRSLKAGFTFRAAWLSILRCDFEPSLIAA